MSKENVFDERGDTVSAQEVVVPEVPQEVAQEEVVAAPEAPAAGGGKYRVGDKYFDKQEDALDEANRLIMEQREIDAYRQGQRSVVEHAQTSVASAQNVTQPVPELNTEELYTNPQEFLRKRDEQVESRVLNKLDAREAQKAESDRIWREFTDRHPKLANFRKEVESYVAENQSDIRIYAGAKGLPAAYDKIATSLQARFAAYADAVKPSRELPNSGSSAVPIQKGADVTPKVPSKKVLSLAEQLKQTRATRR